MTASSKFLINYNFSPLMCATSFDFSIHSFMHAFIHCATSTGKKKQYQQQNALKSQGKKTHLIEMSRVFFFAFYGQVSIFVSALGHLCIES